MSNLVLLFACASEAPYGELHSTTTSFTLEYLKNPSEFLHPCVVMVKDPAFIKNKKAVNPR